MSPVRVFLADDYAIVREGLRALVNRQEGMTVVGEAGNGVSAVSAVAELQPHVVVMDDSLSNMGVGVAVDRLRAACPEVRVLALTVHEDSGSLKRMLESGAAGYALMRGATESLITAIRTVAVFV